MKQHLWKSFQTSFCFILTTTKVKDDNLFFGINNLTYFIGCAKCLQHDELKISSSGRLINLNLTFILFIRSKKVLITVALLWSKFKHTNISCCTHWRLSFLITVTTIWLQFTVHDDLSNECSFTCAGWRPGRADCSQMLLNFWRRV